MNLSDLTGILLPAEGAQAPGVTSSGEPLMESAVRAAQTPLRSSYKGNPSLAQVTDHARTSGESPTDPFHSRVEPMDGCGVVIPVGTHAGVGGPHDAPTPGDMLCAALAACQDSSFRMVANLFGVKLTGLEVVVTATADLRGTLGMDPGVPVGFQAMNCEVRFSVKEGTPAELVSRLQRAAYRSCVVQQTLKSPPPVKTTFSGLESK